MTTLSGQLFAITGAASGIGLATAQLLARRGAYLALSDINRDRLQTQAETIVQSYPDTTDRGQKSAALPSPLITDLDVRDAAAVSSWLGTATKHFGRPLTGAANMAGIVGRSLGLSKGSIRNVSEQELKQVWDVNVTGTWNCVKAELQHLRTGPPGSGRGGGSIVNAASIAGLVGVENNSPYVMAKHAIIGLTKTVAKEEGHHGIRVNAIAPGIISTPMIDGIMERSGRIDFFVPDADPGAMARKGDANEAASVVEFLLDHGSTFVSGQIINVDGGWIC